jgi:hypothetical protein
MTSEGLGDVFEGDSADTCGGKCWLMLMGGRAEGLACAVPGASGNFYFFLYQVILLFSQQKAFTIIIVKHSKCHTTELGNSNFAFRPTFQPSFEFWKLFNQSYFTK